MYLVNRLLTSVTLLLQDKGLWGWLLVLMLMLMLKVVLLRLWSK